MEIQLSQRLNARSDCRLLSFALPRLVAYVVLAVQSSSGSEIGRRPCDVRARTMGVASHTFCKEALDVAGLACARHGTPGHMVLCSLGQLIPVIAAIPTVG